jgi:hypothetical protein
MHLAPDQALNEDHVRSHTVQGTLSDKHLHEIKSLRKQMAHHPRPRLDRRDELYLRRTLPYNFPGDFPTVPRSSLL